MLESQCEAAQNTYNPDGEQSGGLSRLEEFVSRDGFSRMGGVCCGRLEEVEESGLIDAVSSSSLSEDRVEEEEATVF